MKIRPLSISDINAVVVLHRLCLPKTTTSQLGGKYMAIIYNKLLSLPVHHVLLGAYDETRLIGVVTATDSLSFTSKNLSPTLFGPQTKIIFNGIANGSTSFLSLAKRFILEKILASQFEHPYPTILTLFIHESYRRKGIAKRLIEELETNMKENGCKKLFVDTEKNNESAKLFYETMGFKKQKEIFGAVIFSKTLAESIKKEI